MSGGIAASPLCAGYPDHEDVALVARARDGERDALRALVERHQPFVYNVALKMFGRRADAEDLTQEVMVKVITSLDRFRGESAFRTWLYRVTVNHFLKSRRRGMEARIERFDTFFDELARVPDEQPGEGEPEIAGAAVEELRIRCTTGMLMCLDREQRIVFILGAVFEVPHAIAAEILEITAGAFRVRLHRARSDLHSWMRDRCGLVSPASPCRCHKKTRAYVRMGAVDPERLEFNADYVVRVEDVVRRGAERTMQTVDDVYDRVFREHPWQLSAARVVDEVLGHPELRDFFRLEG